jgi:Uma2 family endonuclease
MLVATEAKLLTAEEFARLPDDGMRHELVRGQVRTMPPASGGHGVVAAEALRRLANHVLDHKLGYVFAAETGFFQARDPDVVRAPDVAFIRAGRLPEPPGTRGFMEITPDLVVEVVSTWDSATDVQEKVLDWLAVGGRLVLVLHPTTRSITAYRSASSVRLLRDSDELDADDVVPGFRCTVGELFLF